MDGQINNQIWIDRQLDKWMNRQIIGYRLIDKYRLIERQIDRVQIELDKQMDRQIIRYRQIKKNKARKKVKDKQIDIDKKVKDRQIEIDKKKSRQRNNLLCQVLNPLGKIYLFRCKLQIWRLT